MNKVFHALLRGWPCVLIWPRCPASLFLSLHPLLRPRLVSVSPSSSLPSRPLLFWHLSTCRCFFCLFLSLSLSLLFFSRWRFSERCRIRLMRGYEEFFPSLFFLFFFFSRFSQEMLFVLGRVELEWNTN